MLHAAFANAGEEAGLDVWRIENFEPARISSRHFGKFFSGDSYIVLKTTGDAKSKLYWNIHYWLGKDSSQDEMGAAAILSVSLDEQLHGAAVQHREVEGHESQQFLDYFAPAISYLDGGHASGFQHVTTNGGSEKRLFQVKGKKQVRVRQVAAHVSSMNKGDCFILDVEHEVWVYAGESSARTERLRAVSVANHIRDRDHNGRANVHIIDDSASIEDVQKFFAELGSGSLDLVAAGDDAGGDDEAFERGEENNVTLYEVSDSSGTLKVTALNKPYKMEQLNPLECYILDTRSSGIFVWVGKGSNNKEKSEAMLTAQKYLGSKGLPPWVHITRIPQGVEPAVFKQYFAA